MVDYTLTNTGAQIDAALQEVVALTGSTVGTSDTQTLTNKTLTSPNINEAVALTSTATELNLLDGITALSGSDTVLISGTAGTNGNIAQWNADGDLIDGSIAVSNIVTAASSTTFTNKTFDANGTGNSLSNVETADIASGSKSGSDVTLITGTAGTASDLAIWNGDGDLVDGPTPPSGAIVGTTDTQTLTNKTIAAESNTATIFTESHAASHTLSAAECYGAVYYVTAAATLTLPAVADGMHLTVITIGAVAVSVDPNASDKIWLDGTALDDGDKITNTSTAGDIAVLTYYSADGWHASTNTWTDGGA